jgi:PEGA domain
LEKRRGRSETDGNIVLWRAAGILLVSSLSMAAQSATQGTLVIQSKPGAHVFVDGTQMGTTSAQGRLRLSLSPGKHSLRVTLAGFADWSGSAMLVAGQTSLRTAALTPSQNLQAGAKSAGPSLAETLNFMSQALASDGGGQRSMRGNNGWTTDWSFHTSLTSNGSCMATIGVTVNTSSTYPTGQHCADTGTQSLSLNLGDIDPSSVKYSAAEGGSDQYATSSTSGYIVRVATSNLDKKIAHSSQSSGTCYANNGDATPRNDGPKQDQVSQIEFFVADGDIATRIAHAMTHAVELCGGQKSAF